MDAGPGGGTNPRSQEYASGGTGSWGRGRSPEDQWRWPGGRAGAAGNPEVRRPAMGIRCAAIRSCGRGKIDTGVPRMAVQACGAAAVVVALLSAAIALQWSPLHAGTGRGRLCLALERPAPGSRWDRPA